MNPEELIAMLKSLFGVAELSPTAMKNIGEMGAEAAPGMKRLFRGEALPGAIEGKGQMFTHDPEVAARFAKNTADEPMVNAVDVKDIAADHGNLSEKGVGLRDFGREGVPRKARTDETVFLPRPTAMGKRQIFPAVAATSVPLDRWLAGGGSPDAKPGDTVDFEDGRSVQIELTAGGPRPTVPAPQDMRGGMSNTSNVTSALSPVLPMIEKLLNYGPDVSRNQVLAAMGYGPAAGASEDAKSVHVPISQAIPEGGLAGKILGKAEPAMSEFATAKSVVPGASLGSAAAKDVSLAAPWKPGTLPSEPLEGSLALQASQKAPQELGDFNFAEGADKIPFKMQLQSLAQNPHMRSLLKAAGLLGGGAALDAGGRALLDMMSAHKGQ